MLKRTVCVRNTAGIHCRPAGEILNVINSNFSDTRFTLVYNSEEIEITGILSLVSLCLCCGSKAELRAEGGNEDMALQEIGDLLEKEFDFPPR